jgi:hypothetical protein
MSDRQAVLPDWLPGTRLGALLVSFQIPTEMQPEFNRWYNREHIPARIGLGPLEDGFHAATRYLTTGPEPRFVNFYELGTTEFLASPQYLAVRAAEAEMPIVARLGGEMRRTRPDLFSRRVLRTSVRGQISDVPGPMVLETVAPSDAAEHERLLAWAALTYLGMTARSPGVAASIVGIAEDGELVFITVFDPGLPADWTELEAGVAKPGVSRITDHPVSVDVCVPLARFTGLRS